jgi:hypothetical protein
VTVAALPIVLSSYILFVPDCLEALVESVRKPPRRERDGYSIMLASQSCRSGGSI